MTGGQTEGVLEIPPAGVARPMQPTIRTFVLADLKCYLCGATAGSIERERGSRISRVSMERGGRVRPVGAGQTAQLRCPRCGGSLYVDQVEIVDRRIEPIEWEDEGPRRGRPPKWLVEQRRRKRERELTA
jgi:hypothetical protein